MSVTPSSPVVGVFKDRSVALQAVDALRSVGFEPEQIQYSGPASSGKYFKGFFTVRPRPARLPGQILGGPFEDLRSFFTGTNHSAANLAYNLTSMGLSDSEVHYYSNEYKNGNTILAVTAAGREREAMSILQRYGAYTANGTKPGFSREITNNGQQPTGNGYQDNDTASERRDDVQDEGTYQPAKTDGAIPGQEGTYQAAPSRDTGYDPNNPPPEAGTATSFRPAETSMPQTSSEPSGTLDELQQLQTQIQAAQRQLQDAKAELQAVREREAQLRSAKEYRRQIQDARQQLQAIQAELESTRAELRESQARVAQYR